MTLFKRPKAPQPPPEPSRPEPLSRDRIEKYLSSRNFKFMIDGEEVCGLWDGHSFAFLRYGGNQDILQVRGRWARTLDSQDQGEIRLAVNDWNRERYWPKAYYRAEGDELAVYAEVSVTLAAGVTDAQLGQAMECGLFTGLQFFNSLNQRFGPDDEQ